MFKHIKLAEGYTLKGIKLIYPYTGIKQVIYFLLAQAQKVSVKTFVFLYLRPALGVTQLVHMEVKRQLRANMRNWLYQNRIMHCARCLGMSKQLLRATDTDYLCPPCMAAVKQNMQAQAAAANG